MSEKVDAKYKHYLHDLGTLLRERALEAKSAKKDAKEKDRDYAAGRLMAFNEIVSIMQQQAEGMSIPLNELRLDGIDPDRDLL